MYNIKKELEAPGIDPGTSRMLSERSTIWATPPLLNFSGFLLNSNCFKVTSFLVLNHVLQGESYVTLLLQNVIWLHPPI